MVVLVRFPVLALVLFACGAPNGDVGEIDVGLTQCAQGGTASGIDVSRYQGTIDWAQVAGAQISFAIMKATEGLTLVDSTFAANWSGAAQKGIVRGSYHFFRASVDPTMQADHYLQTLGMPTMGDLPPALDLEVTDGQSPSQVVAAALQFLQRIEQLTGRLPLLYTSPSFFSTTLGGPVELARYPLWIAHWQVQCPNVPSPPFSQWTFWQSSSTGTVAGISGAVDLDQFNGSAAALRAFASPVLDGGVSDGGAPMPSGCSCQVGAPSPSGRGWLWALALLTALWLSRRRLLRRGS
jgi:lysozyme